jgi:hypothetical protein
MDEVLASLARAKRALHRARQSTEAWKFDPDNLTEAEAVGAIVAWIDGARLLVEQAACALSSVWGTDQPKERRS